VSVLVVDVGGHNVKALVTGRNESRSFASGPAITAEDKVAGVKNVTVDWKYDGVSIGYPSSVTAKAQDAMHRHHPHATAGL
jgi:polyphosphate glucokinase